MQNLQQETLPKEAVAPEVIKPTESLDPMVDTLRKRVS